MSDWPQRYSGARWTVIHHTLAIAGRVIEDRAHATEMGRPIGGCQVVLSSASHSRSTRTTVDGQFHFVDLPDGQYALTAALPEAGSRYATRTIDVTLSRDDQGRVVMAEVTIALPPTALKGAITAQATGDAVSMAEVQVKGSGERTFSDDKGAYYLAGLEAGTRAVIVTARGKMATRTVRLSRGQTEELNVGL